MADDLDPAQRLRARTVVRDLMLGVIDLTEAVTGSRRSIGMP